MSHVIALVDDQELPRLLAAATAPITALEENDR
jgi:hypothetical protein